MAEISLKKGGGPVYVCHHKPPQTALRISVFILVYETAISGY